MPKMADGQTAIETPLLFLQVCVFTMNLSFNLDANCYWMYYKYANSVFVR